MEIENIKKIETKFISCWISKKDFYYIKENKLSLSKMIREVIKELRIKERD